MLFNHSLFLIGMPLANRSLGMGIHTKILAYTEKIVKRKKKIIIILFAPAFLLLVALQAGAGTLQRSSFIVSNLSCTSCLATIESELKGMPGVVGMDADLDTGRVTVNHFPSLEPGRIADSISNLGYPAKMDWTATLPEQYTSSFTKESRYSSGCSIGGCGVPGGAGTGLTAWKAAPDSGVISRTTLQVSNLSCTSCLNNIAQELSSMAETYGMKGYLNRGIVIVDHTSNCETGKIVEAISNIGYPARIIATNEISARYAFGASPNSGALNPGRGCSGQGPCNATAASWQKLYQRYFTQTDTK